MVLAVELEAPGGLRLDTVAYVEAAVARPGRWFSTSPYPAPWTLATSGP